MSGRSITSWSDLGLLPLQHFERDIDEGRRQLISAARIFEVPNPKRSTDPRNAVPIVARHHDLGTIGDLHPYRLWQTQSRHHRASGSWSPIFGATGTGGSSGGYGRSGTGHPISALELRPIRDSEGRADARYHSEPLSWPANFAAPPRGTILGAIAGTEETEQADFALWGDPRLFAVHSAGPAECGTLVVDLQPDSEPCMDGTGAPGIGGRAARLQSFARVVAMPEGPSPLERIGASPGNVLAWNGALSRQDGLPGLAAVWCELTAGGPSGPTTPRGTVTPPGPITPGHTPRQAPLAAPPESAGGAAGAPPPTPQHQGESAAAQAGGAGGSSGPSSGAQAELEVALRDWGRFEPKPHTCHGLALFAAPRAFGPLAGGSGTCQHVLGRDRDGNPISSGHLATAALWYLRDDRDGPMDFKDELAQRPPALQLRTRVHLVWDDQLRHPWVEGTRRGRWVWEGEAPIIVPDDGDEPPDDRVPPTRTPGSGTPTTPSGPRTGGGGPPGGGPGTGGGGGGQGNPGGGTGAPRRSDMPVLLFGPRGAPGPFNTGAGGGGGGPESGGFGGPAEGASGGPETPGATGNEEERSSPPPDPEIDAWLERQRRRRGARPRAPRVEREASPAAGWTRLELVGETEPSDRALFVLHHPHHESFAALSWRPQLWTRGAPHFERGNELQANLLRNDEARRPQVLSLRAWGAQTADGTWAYAQSPHTSRARGGITSGGVVFSPPHLEGEDLFDAGRTLSPTAAVPTRAAVLLAPNVDLALGLPHLDGGLLELSHRIRQDRTAPRAPLLLEQLDAQRAPVELLRAEIDGASAEAVVSLAGSQAVRIPRGAIASRPSSITPAGGMLRIATDLEPGLDELELYDGQAGTWRRIADPEAALIRARRFVLYEIDGFSSQQGQVNPWTQSSIAGGTVASVATAADLEHHPGILRVSSGAGSNTGWRWHFLAAGLVCTGLDGSISELIFRVQSSSGFRLIFGFHGETGVALPASGVFAYCDGDTFSAYQADAGDRTQSATTYTLSTNKWYRARVAIVGGGSSTFALSEMSGDPVWTADISTDFPASSIVVNHGVSFGRTTAGALAMADFDKMTLALRASRA